MVAVVVPVGNAASPAGNGFSAFSSQVSVFGVTAGLSPASLMVDWMPVVGFGGVQNTK